MTAARWWSASSACSPTARPSCRRRRRAWRTCAGTGCERVLELTEFLVDVLGVEDVGATFPHRVVYHSTCHSLRLLEVGDRPLRLLRAVQRHRPRRARGRARVLRLRRDVRGQERGHLDGDALRQAAPRARHARGGLHVGRQLVPDAHRRRAAGASAPACAPCTSPRSWRRPSELPRRGPRGARRRPAAPQPRQGDDDDPRQARAGGGARSPTGRRCATPARRSRRARWRRCPSSSSAWRRRSRAAGGVVHWARDARGGQRASSRGIAREHGAREVIKVKSLATDEIGLNDALAGAGHRGDRDRPRRADHPARARHVVAHPRARDPQEPGRDPGAVRAHDRQGRAPGLGGERRSPRPRGATCARSSSPCRMAIAARTSAIAETGTICVVESEGNGRMCTTLPEVLVTVMGIEKMLPEWRDLEVFLQLLPRSSTAERMNPYTSLWTGVREDDGPQRVPPRAARQRAHRRARRRGRPPGAALHPLLGVPERLPGVLAHGRPRLRVGLSRPDRRDPHAAAARARPGADAAVGLDRCAAPATRSARSRSTSRPCSSTCAARVVREQKSRLSPEALAMEAIGRVFGSQKRYEARSEAHAARPRAASRRPRFPAGPPCASSRRCPPRRSGSGGARARHRPCAATSRRHERRPRSRAGARARRARPGAGGPRGPARLPRRGRTAPTSSRSTASASASPTTGRPCSACAATSWRAR